MAGDGPQWTFAESDLRAHEFLVVVAGERDLDEQLDDPVEHARANSLMILFSADVQEAFETLLARMPEPRVDAWRDLIAGGANSEAFGPLTLQEQLDEKQVEAALQSGRRQRIVSSVLGLVVLGALGAGAVVAWDIFVAVEERTEGALRFDDLDSTPSEAAAVGGPPVAEPRLTAALTTAIAVSAGEGPTEDRITTAPFSTFPYPPGALRASLFQYAGSGHVVVVGPDGFVDDSCLRASVVTSDLRPLDIVTHGPCTDPIGREATIGCLGPSAVLLDLIVPPGAVSLPEGGTGFADAVRVQLVADDERYELLTIRATIEVGVGEDITVPRFGGNAGDTLTFDLGADRVGICTLTGDLPTRR